MARKKSEEKLNVPDGHYRRVMKFYAIIGCLFLCLTGCLNNNVRHHTTNEISFKDGSSLYPDSRYLTAIGYGNSKSTARLQAKKELSNIFESTITSQFKHETHAVRDSNKGNSTSEKIEAIIFIYSQITLKGVQVKALKSEQGQFTALAVLDKFLAKDNWLLEVNHLDDQMQVEYRNIKKRHSKLLWIKPVQKILHYWMKRRSIVSCLSVIGFKAPSADIHLKTILNMIATIKNSLQFHIHISGVHAKKLSDHIANALNNTGYIICDSRKANVLISGNLTVEPSDITNEDWIYRRAIVSLQVTDPSTNNQVFNISENLRRGHLTTKAATNKAIKAISIAVQKQILKIFDPFKVDSHS